MAQESSTIALSLGAKVDVYPQTPLPEYDGHGFRAYGARLRNDARSDLMALVCTSGLPSRFDLVNAMRTIDNPCVLRLRESGVIHWPPHNASYYALAYERPVAPRYWQRLNETRTPLSEDSLNHYVVAPMISALLEFHRTGIMHGAIRPTNIFWREGAATPPQLGECLATPAGLDQPVLFETIERAMSLPIGRGPGLHVDDCYAFGVTMALMMIGHNPLHDQDDQAILQLKMERGSFNAIVGQRRLAASHIELLRGLLTDDTRQRWTAPDLEQWQNGRRLTPKNTDSGRKASRSLTLGGKEYWQLRPLAAALATNRNEAVKLIEDSSLEKWLMRSLGDEDRAEDVRTALVQLKESGKTARYDDQVVTRVCIALDPSMPIRYRDLAVMPGGIAAMLAEALVTNTDTTVLSEIISSQFVTFWVNMQKEVKTELVPLAQQLERMRSFLEKTTFGNGIERVVYDLNPTLPCLSPMLRAQYVTSSKLFLPALEILAQQGNRPREPMDRHIAAFLVVRDKRGESAFDAMALPEGSPRKGLAILTLYADMQNRHGPDVLPSVASWLMPLVEPSVKRFLSKPLQEKVRRQLKEAAERGVLSNLLKLVDDPKRVEHDEHEFLTSRRMYIDIQREIDHLEAKLNDRESVAQAIGRPIAATLASVLAILLISFAIVRVVLQNLGG